MGEKTEEPTARRKNQARSRGQVPKSQDFSAAFTLFFGIVTVYLLGGTLLAGLYAIMQSVLSGQTPGDPMLVSSVGPTVQWLGLRTLWIVAPVLLLMTAIAYLGQFLQVRWLFTLTPIKPKLSQLNPAAGVKKLFNLRNLVKLNVNITKLAVVGVTASWLMADSVPKLVAIPAMSMIGGLTVMAQLMFRLAIVLALLLLIIGIIDWWYQKWQHHKDLKMTKQEVKDERKSMEGDPHVKKRRLEMAYAAAMQRIRSDVPTADVVVTNPTHFSVAIRYEAELMRAPRVVAKGADFMAFRIRQVAAAHRVPIVERPPLARALYWNVEVGEEIPEEHYQAVAEILAYVYRMEGRVAA